MIYFGQEVGEAGNEMLVMVVILGIVYFDYIGVPNHQRWMNNGKFDGITFRKMKSRRIL
jgi:hypothetical protein